MLDLADKLAAEEGRSSSAVRRRAISTAYYAVFHAVVKICADSLLQPGATRDRTSDEYARVYRALEHGTLKNAFAQEKSPLRSRQALRRIGELIVPLRSARFIADYSPPVTNVFTPRQGRDFVAQARKAVSELNGLDDEDRRVLAAWLLFKNPPQ
jgi:aminoglycoside phosphotransferase (APT) family kinase protein